MCHTGKVFLLLIFALLGCSSPKSATKPEDVYRFTERPYDVVQVADRELYNYVFNVIRNKLVFYVLENNPNTPEPLGVVLELDRTQTKGGLEKQRNAPALRGWFLFARDSVPVDEGFLAAYRNQTLPDSYRDLAKALFWIESIDKEHHKVFVRYWVHTTITEFWYEVKKVGSRYMSVNTVLP